MMLPETLETFVASSPSPWHVVEQISALSQKAGAATLNEKTSWSIEPSSFYIIRRGCSCILIKTPSKRIEKVKIVAAHTDSPALKVKPYPLAIKEGHALLQLEPYGVPILSSWIGRDLRLSGMILRSGKQELVDLNHAAFIPHIAFHLDRTVNDAGHQVLKHDHLFAMGKEHAFLNDPSITFKDLFLVSDEKAEKLKDCDLIAGPRLDNLACLYAAFAAFIGQKTNDADLLAFVAWNHEEIGSQSAEGALSPFLSDTLERISFGFKLDRAKFLELKASTTLISCDVAHGYHPNYPEKHDLKHTPKLGSGVVIKTNPNMRYSQTANLTGLFVRKLQEAQIPYSYFSLKNDMQSGSTVGPLISSQMGIETIDIGIPLLGMHSIRELVSGSDVQALEKSLSAFLS